MKNTTMIRIKLTIYGLTMTLKERETHGSSGSQVTRIMSIPKPFLKKDLRSLKKSGNLTFGFKSKEDSSRDGTEVSTRITTGNCSQGASIERLFP